MQTVQFCLYKFHSLTFSFACHVENNDIHEASGNKNKQTKIDPLKIGTPAMPS
jgi:hypothetical protein